MKHFPRASLLMAILLSTSTVFGAAVATPHDGGDLLDRIRTSVERATGLRPESVEPSKLMPGFYEVRAGTSIGYVDGTGQRMLTGQVIDLATGDNLTQRTASGAPARINLADLPTKDAITTVSGNGSRRLAVFVDPACTFCRTLEPELILLKDVTIHRFLLPVLGPGSRAAAQKVWCAKDRTSAWRRAVAGELAAEGTTACDTAVLDRNVALAKQLNVGATPTLIFSDGSRVAAAMTMSQIDERLNQVAVRRPY